ncbi:MAG TPA: class I SAM-dependent methyltransferase [Gemmatales bacterium]|nr:class I SAM-dependent methyltransferase [Gemmatales bacterium]
MSPVPNNCWPISPSAESVILEEYAKLIGIDPQIEWQMESSEQLALLVLAQHLKPVCSVEVGSRYGGSMQILSRYSQRVISCDIDPTCQARLGHQYSNVEFITGDSKTTLPGLWQRLQADAVPVGLLLIDGDHTAAGVQADIHSLLNYVPVCTLYVILHDSFNPAVRRGIRSARWAENPHVHSVEVDFIPGVLHRGGEADREMWGGFSLAILHPRKRTGHLEVSARKDELFQAVLRRSAHWPFDPPTLLKRARRKFSRLLGIDKKTSHP